MIFCLPHCSSIRRARKNLRELAPKSAFLQRKTISRELLGDRASALPHMSGREIFQGGADNAPEIVTTVLVEFVVFNRNNRIHQIARYLVVRNRFAILNVDLAKNLV